MSIDKLKTKFFTGAWLTDVKYYFSKINEIIDWINNIGTPSYKVYTALLTQTGTSDPVATILDNTLIGIPTWTRVNTGVYTCTLNSGFIGNTIVLATTSGFFNDSFCSASKNDDNSIELHNMYVATADNVISDDVFSISIEIRVYN